jgi:hypothetical protein
LTPTTQQFALPLVLPSTTLIRRGRKGEARFFRGVPGQKAKAFSINKARVVDLITDGGFCVLPPTLHPDTKQPYQWIGPDPLEDVAPQDLPELPADIVERLEGALRPFGYQPEPERAPLPAGGESNADHPYRQVNDWAMANFDAWVPGLDLYRCRRTGEGYKAVATWRASNGGNPPERRKLNLSIHPTGIKDFGDGPRPYTPVDLYAKARGVDPGRAFVELSRIRMGSFVVNLPAPEKAPSVAAEPAERAMELGNNKEDSESRTIFAVVLANHDYRKIDDEITTEEIELEKRAAREMFCSPPMSDLLSEDELERARNIPDEVAIANIRAGRRRNAERREAYDRTLAAWKRLTPEEERRGNVATVMLLLVKSGHEAEARALLDKYKQGQDVGLAPFLVSFEFDDNSPIIRPEYFVEDMIPVTTEIAFIGGQSGAGKTFIAVHLGVCLASGTPFFGREIERRRGTVILAAEGAGTIKNRLRVAREQWAGNEPLPISFRRQVSSLTDERELGQLIRELQALSKHFRNKYDVPLGAVIIDTMTAAFELKDENDNSEAARIIKSLKWVGNETGTLMIPLHHYGKSTETGLRGASAYRAGCDVVLSVLADRNQITGQVSKTELALAKSRVDAEGPISPFVLRFSALGKKPNGDEWGSLYVDPLLHEPSTIAGTAKTSKEPASLVHFHAAFANAMAAGGSVVIAVRGGSQVRAVPSRVLRTEFYSRYPTGETDPAKRRNKLKSAFARALAKAVEGKYRSERQDGVEYLWPVKGSGLVMLAGNHLAPLRDVEDEEHREDIKALLGVDGD